MEEELRTTVEVMDEAEVMAYNQCPLEEIEPAKGDAMQSTKTGIAEGVGKGIGFMLAFGAIKLLTKYGPTAYKKAKSNLFAKKDAEGSDSGDHESTKGKSKKRETRRERKLRELREHDSYVAKAAAEATMEYMLNTFNVEFQPIPEESEE